MIPNLERCFLKLGVPYSVYSNYICGDTLQDLLSNMCALLNMVVDNVNEYNEIVNALKKWIEEEGLQNAVDKKLEEMINDGTFDNIINQKIFGDLQSLVNQNEKRILNLINVDVVVDYEFIDGEDNTDKFIKLFNELKSNTRINIPKGEYQIILTDKILTKVSNGYALIFKENLENVTIGGDGLITIDTSRCTLKNWVINFYNCKNMCLDNFRIKGDYESKLNVTVRDSFPNGIYFEKSENIFVKNSKFSNLLAPLSTTGSGSSPSVTIDVTKNIIITDNIFEDYGQISTYGGGASKLLFTNNVMINPLQTGFKISRNPLISEITRENSNQILIENNIIYWTSDFKFGLTSWEPTKTYSPCGLMVESKTDLISLNNNSIYMGSITQNLNNPIQTIASIIVYKASNNLEFQNEKLVISDNTCVTYRQNSDISISPYCKEIIVKDNLVHNGISVVTFGQPKQIGSVILDSNTISGGYGVIALRCNIDKVIIKDNNFINSNNSIIELSNCNIDDIIIHGNNMSDGRIYTVGDVISNNVFVKENKLIKTVNLTLNVKNLNIKDNFTVDNITHYTLSLQDDSKCYFDGNSGECSSIINQTNGKLYLGSNPMETKSAVIYSLTNVTVMSGLLYGSGAPNFKTLRGVQYIDTSSSITETFYIQVDPTGSNWKKIQYV